MTGDLRTRIAAVLYTRAMSRLSWHRDWEDLHPDVQQLWLDDADAVIRELKLDGHTESFIDADGDERCSTCDKWLEPGYYTLRDHRAAMLRDVVTEWTTD